MLQRFLDRVDPWGLCDRGETISGEIPLARFARLAPYLADDSGLISATLHFSRGDKRKAVINGNVTGELRLICQRCLGPLTYLVDADMDLLLTQGPEESAQVAQDRDYQMIGDGESVVLLDLVEDELLLAIPDLPRHESQQCNVPEQVHLSGSEQVDQEELRRDNPFAVLESLKDK